MAIKPFNSVGGYSVGPNLTPFLDADNNATVANLTVEGNISGNIASLSLTGDLTVAGLSNLANLDVSNAATFGDTVDITGILTVTDDIVANAELLVTGNANISTNLKVSGTSNVAGTSFVGGDLTANANLIVSGNANVTGTSNVAGAATFGNTATVTGTFTASANANVTGNLNVTANANITGDLNLTGALDVTGESIFGAMVTVSSGDLTVNDGLTVHGNVILDADVVGGTIAIGQTGANATDVTIAGASVDIGEAANLFIHGGSNGQYLRTLDSATGAVEWATVDTDTLANGTSNVDIPVADGNVLVTVGGVANVAVFTTDGANIKANLTVTDTVTAPNLSITTLANVAELQVVGNANVTGNIFGNANLDINGTTTLDGDLTVTGAANIDNTLSVTDTLTGLADFELTGTANVGNLVVNGTTDLGAVANITIDGGATDQVLVTNGSGVLSWSSAPNIRQIINGTSNVQIPTADGNITMAVGGDEMVVVSAGLVELDGNVTANGYLSVQSSIASGEWASFEGDLTVGSALGAQSNAYVYGNIAANLNITANGSATIEGNINGNTNLNLDGTANITGEALIGGNANITGNISFVGGNATTLDLTSGLTTGTITANGNVTLGTVANVHIAGGTDGQVLRTDGAGNLTWSSDVNVSAITNGTTTVAIPTADGNVVFDVSGQANVIIVSSDGTHATTSITDDVLITGNLTVQGNVTNIDSTTLNVEDPVITEGRGANNAALTANDGFDRGLYSWYFNGSEKGGFVGYKNSVGDFAGKYVVASEATLVDNTVTVTTYADVVVSSIVSGADTSGSTAIDLNAANVAINADGTAGVLTVSGTEVAAIVDVSVTGGNIAVAPVGNNGSSQITLTTGDGVSNTETTIGTGYLISSSVTPTPIVTIADAVGRTVEFFISARDVTNGNFEGAKYLVVSDGAGVVDSTSYGTVRIGTQTQQVEVTFAKNGADLEARVAVLNNTDTTVFSTQYQIVG